MYDRSKYELRFSHNCKFFIAINLSFQDTTIIENENTYRCFDIGQLFSVYALFHKSDIYCPRQHIQDFIPIDEKNPKTKKQ